MVANWDSDVGYAWWLMESFWIVLANEYDQKYIPLLAYPTISTIPSAIELSPIKVRLCDFSSFGLAAVFRQLGFILKNKIRLIYFSDKPAYHWVYFFYRMFGVKIIVIHDHTPGLRDTPLGFKKWLKQRLQNLPIITADICIGATEFITRRFIEVACVPAGKCFTAANGIPLKPVVEKDIYKTFNIPTNRKLIVTAARANRYKGVAFALETLSHIRKTEEALEWHYVFMGDGPHLNEFVLLADRLEIADCVTFAGRVQDVAALCMSADVAFQPSLGEVGYSLSILEYMWAGLPVLVSDNPSVCAATTHKVTGMIYKEGSVASAAELLVILLKDEKAGKAMGMAARQIVEEKFSLEKTHQDLREIFSSIPYLQSSCI